MTRLKPLLVVDKVMARVHADGVLPQLLVVEGASMFELAIFPWTSILLVEVVAQFQSLDC